MDDHVLKLMKLFTTFNMFEFKKEISDINSSVKYKSRKYAFSNLLEDYFENYEKLSTLHQAVIKGQLDLVLELLSNGNDINVKTVPSDFTPLDCAVLCNNLDLVEMLICHGANMDKPGSNHTPLNLACENGFYDIANVLIKNNAYFDSDLLHAASEDGNFKMVKFLLEKEHNPNIRNEYDMLPLHYACKEGHLEIVKILITYGSDINGTAMFKSSNKNVVKNFAPIHLAVALNTSDVLKVLIKAKANVNIVSSPFGTPLHLAVIWEDMEKINILLKAKADVNAEITEEFITPLHIATHFDNIKFVSRLLKAGANVNSQTASGITSLHIASENGNLSIIDCLLKAKASLKVTEHTKKLNALHFAIYSNYLHVVKYFLFNKVDGVNETAVKNVTNLHLACGVGNLEIVKVLLKYTKEINAIEEDNGYTPLHISIIRNFNEVSLFLIQHGANVNIVDKESMTLLHHAVGTNCPLTVIDALIKKRVNLNAKTADKFNALHIAVTHDYLDIAKLLIKNKIDINAKRERDFTPLCDAIANNNIAIIEALLEGGADVNVRIFPFNVSLVMSFQDSTQEVISLLMKWGVDINAEIFPDRPVTILHLVVYEDCIETIEKFLKAGANVCAVDDKGFMPIHIAADDGNNDKIDILLKYGATLTSVDVKNKYTPLHIACKNGHYNTVIHLIYKGADVNSEDKFGFTPVHLASLKGHLDIVKYLLLNGAYFDSSVNNKDISPLSLAKMKSQKIVVDFLQLMSNFFYSIKNNEPSEVLNCMKKGIIINAKSYQHGTALLHASWKGYINIVKLLLKNNADPNLTGKNNLTPLHYAAKYNHLEIVHFLLNHRSMFNIKSSKTYKTPLDFAKESHNTTIISVLEQVTEVFDHIQCGSTDIISKLNHIAKTDINVFFAIIKARNCHGQTLMQVALQNNHGSIAQSLIEVIRRHV